MKIFSDLPDADGGDSDNYGCNIPPTTVSLYVDGLETTCGQILLQFSGRRFKRSVPFSITSSSHSMTTLVLLSRTQIDLKLKRLVAGLNRLSYTTEASHS